MHRTLLILLIPVMLIGAYRRAFLGESVWAMPIQSGGARGKTVWDGVYTAAQATRGKAQYEANCGGCHGNILGGDKADLLKGSEFMQRWREDNLESLFTFLKASMPPVRSRAKEYVAIDDSAYLDILVYILQANEFPAGSEELNAKVLESIPIEEKDGPKPLPTSALVQVVGCMTKSEEIDGIVWMLTRASEPTRTRNSLAVTADELKAAEAKPLATRSFRLQNVGYLGSDFNPNLHNGHKMHAKGVLIRQPNGQRIDITSLIMVDSKCVK